MKNFYLLLSFLFLSHFTVNSQDCVISNLVVESSTCDENGFFTVDIDFEIVNMASASFSVVGNGTSYGSFEYSALPITIGPLLGDNETSYEFVVFDDEAEQCFAFSDLGIIDCGPFCTISNAALELIECQSNITAIVILDFDFENVTNAAFDLFNSEGGIIGSWLYQDLPVTIANFPVNGNDSIQVTICDNDNESCCESFTFDPIDCNPNNCEIFNLTAVPTCEGEQFTVAIDFDIANGGNDGFSIAGNGNQYGNFSYDDLPVILGPFAGDGVTPWEFVVNDIQIDNCSNFVDLGPVTCPMGCSIDGLVAETIECAGNEAYSVVFEAEVANPGNDGFTLFTQNQVIGVFSYEDLPLTIDSFPASGNFLDVVTMCDNQNEDCCLTIEFEALLCNGCLLYDMTTQVLPCNEEGEFTIILDFQHQNGSDQGFQVGGNGNIYGQFNYSDLPITLGPFNGDGSLFYEFIVFDLANNSCLTAIEVGNVDCDLICNIGELFVTELECSGVNTYVFDLNFEHTGTDSSGFDVFANGAFFGFYSYDDLPVSIEGFPASGEGNETITVCNNDNNECCSTATFEAIDCGPPCEIFDLVAETVGCTSDSTFQIALDFEWANFDGNGFDIYGNDSYLGFFLKGDGALTIENFPSTDLEQAFVTVCVSDDTLCCSTQEFAGLICNESDSCAIWDIEVFEIECNTDTSFSMLLDFNWSGTPFPNIFIITQGNNELGTYEKGEGPLTIDGVYPSDIDEVTITICPSGLPECCTDFTFDGPNCETDTCFINDIVIGVGECITDSTFLVEVNFNAPNGQSGFDVYQGDDYVGFFTLGDNGFVIEHYPVAENGLNSMTICYSDDSVCCETIEFEGLICSENNCQITELVVDDGECTSDSTFNIVIQFDFQNTQSDTFVLTSGDFSVQFVKGEEPVTIENFPSNNSGNYFLTVCAIGAEDCCKSKEFSGPTCSVGECQITDLQADATECISDSSFNLVVEFNSQNTPNDTFEIFSGDSFLGLFVKGEDPITIENYPANNLGNYVLTVCATGLDACCAVIEFSGPVCSGECSIFNIEVTEIECQSTESFSALVDFDFVNVEGNAFDIYSGETFLGFFEAEDFPATVSGFPTPEGDVQLITICVNDDSTCCTTIEFIAPDCSESFCDIFEMEYSISDCDSLDNFFVTIDFDFVNVGDLGFSLAGNATNYGSFNYSALPITIGPLAADPEIEYEFLAVDLENNACFDFVDVGVVSCEPSGLFNIRPWENADIRYENGNAKLFIPLNDLTLRVFQTDGHLIYSSNNMPSNQWFNLANSITSEGLFFLELSNKETRFIGKFIR